MTIKTQEPAVAGLFYPAQASELRREVRGFVAAAKTGLVANPKALIAPHAGYVYSGPVAGSAYAQLAGVAERIRRVVLFAPAHRVPFIGIACNSARRFRTPLGEIEVDQAALERIADLPQVRLLDTAFRNEHSIEVHLPFLQETLRSFKLVPLLVGDAEPGEVEAVMERLWGGDETLIVISSDLSHYLDYDSARRMDAHTTEAIEHLAPERISFHHACGRIPVNGLLLAAKHHHLRATTLDLRNSGDTAGPRDQVVGYGAYAFSQTEAP
jgi:MEMO1 family protein